MLMHNSNKNTPLSAFHIFFNRKVLSYLEDLLIKRENPELTEDLHMWPDYHGNRSPLADATLKGMLSGLTLANSRNNLAAIYLATMQALAVNHCSRPNIYLSY